jgi:hypothetical protein
MDHTDIVAKAKADLQAKGVDLTGACGAFRILNLVAQRLPGFGLLRKGGGNRAVPQPDGSCLSGEQTGEPGFATDYLIDRATFFGYDILGDGGGANTPQWHGPETDAAMVARNRTNVAEPLDWPPVHVPGPDIVVVPDPKPDHVQNVDLTAILERLEALRKQNDANTEKIQQQIAQVVENLEKSLASALPLFSGILGAANRK